MNVRGADRRIPRLAWLALLVVVLFLCAALLSATLLAQPGITTSFADGIDLINFTTGAVWCPRSLIVGWTMGHDWASASNVVVCAQGSSPKIWMQLLWRDGERTVLCVDFSERACQ